MKVTLKRGPLRDKSWTGFTRKEALTKAEALSDLHGNCDIYRADGFILVKAQGWYQRTQDRDGNRKVFSPKFGELKARCSKNIYRIPLMDIQTYLVEMGEDPRIRKLVSWLEKNSKPNHWRLEFVLEAQWYPELVTNDRWLAAAFIRTFLQTKAETVE